jgi:acetyl esterase
MGLRYSHEAQRLRYNLEFRAFPILVRVASFLGRFHPRVRAARKSVVVRRNISYLPTRGRPRRLDVYRPREQAHQPLPIVFYVHGGGFSSLNKDTHWAMALGFARMGYLVFNVNYRLAPKHPFPAPLEDVCAAYRWVIDNGPALGGDIGRIALAGESAGGNLITSLALATTYRRPEPWALAVWNTGVTPAAVLPASGHLQVSNGQRYRHHGLGAHILGVGQSYLQGVDLDDMETLDLADPVVPFERGTPPDRSIPPFLVTCGTWDPLIDDSRRLVAALRELGATCHSHYYPNQGHAFHMLPYRAPAWQWWQDVQEFLAAHV